MKARRYLPLFFALFSLLFVAILLAHEHFNGGVRSHHLLDRADLPAISNWLGLVTLPLLGWLLGVRLRTHMASHTRSGLPARIGLGLICSVLYGAALAASFELGASAVTSGLFLGLFLLAAVLPIYRVECLFGFVVGMTFTFGAVLPALVAALFAAVSILVRFAFRAVLAVVRPPAGPSGAA